MDELKDAARRVQDRARALGLDIAVRQMPASTRTAQEAADACQCGVGQIVKSLVFKGRTSGKPYLLLVSGSNRVNEKGVASALGEPITRPDAQFVRDITGFAIGGIPPLGHDTPMKKLFDQRARAFSAGCVRVQDVFDLGAWIARDEPGGYDRRRIEDILASGQATDITLTRPIPVYFAYITAWAEPDGHVEFRPDIYGRDGLKELSSDRERDPDAPPAPAQGLAP